MKKTYFIPFLLIICLSFVAFQCEEDLLPRTQESEQTELNMLKADIEALANTSICNETFECKFIGFGSKPCGGPWSYLVYSTSIDVEQLKSMVEGYNQKAAIFNNEWGIVSDCTVANPPTRVICENNACVAMY